MKDLTRLPEQVTARLADLDVDLRQAGIAARQAGTTLEVRAREIEVRANDDGTVGLHGYATVYGAEYDVAGGPPYGWTEVVADGACRKSVMERDDVRLLFDHDGIPLARTRSKTMTLESDDTGLLVDVASLDLASPHVQSLRSALERGDLDEMSFSFVVTRQEWNEDYTFRTILEVKLYDVSIVTYPANPATVVALRDQPAPAEPMSLAYAQALALQLATPAS